MSNLVRAEDILVEDIEGRLAEGRLPNSRSTEYWFYMYKTIYTAHSNIDSRVVTTYGINSMHYQSLCHLFYLSDYLLLL